MQRLQPLALSEVPDPEDFFPICKDVAHIDGKWWACLTDLHQLHVLPQG